mmetsp:Transcript_36518/g.41625  ORF Transcript_36518/g.41625 Transcript_36518/m.41625 type:complete len:120 (-) Transcript_36518:20-379(-)
MFYFIKHGTLWSRFSGHTSPSSSCSDSCDQIYQKVRREKNEIWQFSTNVDGPSMLAPLSKSTPKRVTLEFTQGIEGVLTNSPYLYFLVTPNEWKMEQENQLCCIGFSLCILDKASCQFG